VDAGIAIEGGKIVKIAKEANLPPASMKINLNGHVVIPGPIDAHVHLRDQLLAHEEDFFTGTAAAVAGGVTTILDMPNNHPVTKDSASLERRMHVAQRSIVGNVGFYSAFPESLGEISEIVKGGALAFKVYLNGRVGGIDVDDDAALLGVFNEVSKLGIPVAVHSEDAKRVKAVAEKEQMLGHNDVAAYLRAHTPEAEVEAVKRVLRIARKSNVQVHFCHVSSEHGVSLINEARHMGMKVSCEVTPHHLFLTSDDLRRQGAIMLTNPPFRRREIVQKLWKGVSEARIDIVATDHAPHSMRDKTVDSVWEVKPGIPGLETLLPLLLTEVNDGRLTLDDLVRLTAERTAELFRLEGHGLLKEGYNADLAVVDMKRRSRIEASRFYSKAKYSPFDGWQVRGVPVKTFVNGSLAMDGGDVVAKAGAGRVLRGKLSG